MYSNITIRRIIGYVTFTSEVNSAHWGKIVVMTYNNTSGHNILDAGSYDPWKPHSLCEFERSGQ